MKIHIKYPGMAVVHHRQKNTANDDDYIEK